ncbi:MAG: DUF421 domain-containing protein [Clostridiales bacterium]|nr:DUF421 domain-containing protein [Clostridiales bacterium]
MTISFIRSIIIYSLVLIAVRLMGKRQIGELKPHELVITILVSQIATIPMEDNSMPFVNSIIPLLSLIAFELIISIVSMKSLWFRNLLQGRPMMVIRDGKVDEKQLKRLRFTIDDLVDALRSKDVFDISEVDYAIIEPNGSISVMKKPAQKEVTAKMMGVQADDNGMPIAVIIDGKPVSEYFGYYRVDTKPLEKELKKRGVQMQDVLLMSVDHKSNYTIVKKDDAP